MSRGEKIYRENRYCKHEKQKPSFSSVLLDEICRSIDNGNKNHEDMKFYRGTMQNKQSNVKENETEISGHRRREHLIEKWWDEKKVNGIPTCKKVKKHQIREQIMSKSHRDHDFEHALFFSSTSCSSESSSCGFSSSDTDSIYKSTNPKSLSGFVPSRIKPVRTNVPSPAAVMVDVVNFPVPAVVCSDKKSTFYRNGEFYMLEGYSKHEQGGLTVKTKSRATQIYSNLKNMKQPISPGGKITTFLNSLFNNKKRSSSSGKNSPSIGNFNKPDENSTCSSASSFTRSCLSKKSPSTGELPRDEVKTKRNVRFYPVSTIVDEDSKPCGVKTVSTPSAWDRSAAGKLPPSAATEKSRRVEEMARKFLKDYHENQNKNGSFRNLRKSKYGKIEDDDYEDDASCSSSDLFELDLIGKDGYCEELPVYETTHVGKNRVIANGFNIM